MFKAGDRSIQYVSDCTPPGLACLSHGWSEWLGMQVGSAIGSDEPHAEGHSGMLAIGEHLGLLSAAASRPQCTDHCHASSCQF